jgi:hypothetical protein
MHHIDVVVLQLRGDVHHGHAAAPSFARHVVQAGRRDAQALQLRVRAAGITGREGLRHYGTDGMRQSRRSAGRDGSASGMKTADRATRPFEMQDV